MKSRYLIPLLVIVSGTVLAIEGLPEKEHDVASVIVHVIGPVTRPGRQKVKPTSSINEIIATAGGIEGGPKGGVRLSKCRLVRGKEEIQIKRVDFDKPRPGAWKELRAEDVIMFSYSRIEVL